MYDYIIQIQGKKVKILLPFDGLRWYETEARMVTVSSGLVWTTELLFHNWRHILHNSWVYPVPPFCYWRALFPSYWMDSGRLSSLNHEHCKNECRKIQWTSNSNQIALLVFWIYSASSEASWCTLQYSCNIFMLPSKRLL